MQLKVICLSLRLWKIQHTSHYNRGLQFNLGEIFLWSNREWKWTGDSLSLGGWVDPQKHIFYFVSAQWIGVRKADPRSVIKRKTSYNPMFCPLPTLHTWILPSTKMFTLFQLTVDGKLWPPQSAGGGLPVETVTVKGAHVEGLTCPPGLVHGSHEATRIQLGPIFTVLVVAQVTVVGPSLPFGLIVVLVLKPFFTVLPTAGVFLISGVHR